MTDTKFFIFLICLALIGAVFGGHVILAFTDMFFPQHLQSFQPYPLLCASIMAFNINTLIGVVFVVLWIWLYKPQP